jgi:hypothetical protein
MFLDHLVYLKAKARGEKSMPEKRETSEGDYGAVPQGPRDTAKATGVLCNKLIHSPADPVRFAFFRCNRSDYQLS